MTPAPPDARCATHHRAALVVCERCGAFTCDECQLPHCGPVRDEVLERRISQLSVASWGLPTAVLFFCWINAFAWVLLAVPCAAGGLWCGLRAFSLARDAGLPRPGAAVFGVVLSVLALLFFALAVFAVFAVIPP